MRPDPRLFFLDWLRILAFGVLVVYHVGMVYVTWDFHVKSPAASRALEPWMLMSGPWRMSLLFMVSGAATAFMLRRGERIGTLLRQRTARLLLPLLCGVVLLVPPQPYVEVVQKLGYAGSYWDFLGLYFSGDRGFCPHGQCLILPTWNHLWFLPYLWAYTLVLLTTVALAPAWLDRAGRAVQRWLSGAGLWILPVALILAVRLSLFQRFPSTHDLVQDWFNHAIYFPMFLAGVLFAQGEGLWDRLLRARWPALLVAILFWGLLAWGRPAGPLVHGVVAIFQWSALIAAFGFARQWLERDHPWRATLTEAVFPVYLVHQTIIVVAGPVLFRESWPPVVEGVILVGLTFVLSLAGYLAARRSGPLRVWFGLPGRPRAPRLPTTPSE
jgi:glucan biosynthesis protein C